MLSGPSNLFGYDDMWNRPEVLAAEMPSSNGSAPHGPWRRMYAALVGEVGRVRLLDADAVVAAIEVQSSGPDHVLGVPMSFGSGSCRRRRPVRPARSATTAPGVPSALPTPVVGGRSGYVATRYGWGSPRPRGAGRRGGRVAGEGEPDGVELNLADLFGP